MDDGIPAALRRLLGHMIKAILVCRPTHPIPYFAVLLEDNLQRRAVRELQNPSDNLSSWPLDDLSESSAGKGPSSARRKPRPWRQFSLRSSPRPPLCVPFMDRFVCTAESCPYHSNCNDATVGDGSNTSGVEASPCVPYTYTRSNEELPEPVLCGRMPDYFRVRRRGRRAFRAPQAARYSSVEVDEEEECEEEEGEEIDTTLSDLLKTINDAGVACLIREYDPCEGDEVRGEGSHGMYGRVSGPRGPVEMGIQADADIDLLEKEEEEEEEEEEQQEMIEQPSTHSQSRHLSFSEKIAVKEFIGEPDSGALPNVLPADEAYGPAPDQVDPLAATDEPSDYPRRSRDALLDEVRDFMGSGGGPEDLPAAWPTKDSEREAVWEQYGFEPTPDKDTVPEQGTAEGSGEGVKEDAPTPYPPQDLDHEVREERPFDYVDTRYSVPNWPAMGHAAVPRFYKSGENADREALLVNDVLENTPFGVGDPKGIGTPASSTSGQSWKKEFKPKEGQVFLRDAASESGVGLVESREIEVASYVVGAAVAGTLAADGALDNDAPDAPDSPADLIARISKQRASKGVERGSSESKGDAATTTHSGGDHQVEVEKGGEEEESPFPDGDHGEEKEET